MGYGSGRKSEGADAPHNLVRPAGRRSDHDLLRQIVLLGDLMSSSLTVALTSPSLGLRFERFAGLGPLDDEAAVIDPQSAHCDSWGTGGRDGPPPLPADLGSAPSPSRSTLRRSRRCRSQGEIPLSRKLPGDGLLDLCMGANRLARPPGGGRSRAASSRLPRSALSGARRRRDERPGAGVHAPTVGTLILSP